MPTTTKEVTAVLDEVAALYREGGIKRLAQFARDNGIEIGDASRLHTDPTRCLLARIVSFRLGALVALGSYCALVYDLPADDQRSADPAIIRINPIPTEITDAIGEFDNGAADYLFRVVTA